MASSTSSLSHSNKPQLSKFKIALCQITVSSDKKNNIDRARLMIKDAAKMGAKLVVLPEMWNCPYANENFPIYAEDFDNRELSPSFMMLSEVACSEGITVVGGSIPERCGDRLYNTCCVFGTGGNLIAKHRKIHLFDLTGEVCFKESDTITAGDEPTVVDTDVGRIGIGICHDLRFPELAMLYRQRGADIICYPGAFNMSTGNLLWELVQRARAVDNQLFVATCSQARDSSGSYMIWGHSTLVGPFGAVLATSGHEETTIIAEIDYSMCVLRSGYMIWGHSTLVGPFGEVLATSGHEETTIIAEIDYSMCSLRRENLPLEKQKRGDIYQFIYCTNELNSQQ